MIAPSGAPGRARPPAHPEPTAAERRWFERVFRLHHVQVSGWQHTVFVEGSLLLALVLVLADLATAWTLLVLPLATGLTVKFQDVLVGGLRRARPASPRDAGPSSTRD